MVFGVEFKMRCDLVEIVGVVCRGHCGWPDSQSVLSGLGCTAWRSSLKITTFCHFSGWRGMYLDPPGLPGGSKKPANAPLDMVEHLVKFQPTCSSNEKVMLSAFGPINEEIDPP